MNITIVSPDQFGYLIDAYEWAKYLSKKHSVSVICFKNRPEIKLESINTTYIGYTKDIFKNHLKFIQKVSEHISKHQNSIYIFTNVYYAFIFKILHPKIKMVYDIRTLSVSHNKLKNSLQNIFIKTNCLIFSNISIINKELIEKIRINRKKFYELPLGANIIDQKAKFDKDNLKLIYIGTLNNRNIVDTVKGIYLFETEHPDIKVTYTIIGKSIDGEVEKEIKKYIFENHLKSKVTLTGYLRHEELETYLRSSNIGVSYIPLKKFYENQPPTKTYEYLLAGIPVLGTSTKAHTKIINSKNGILIKDSPKNFEKGLEKIYINLNKYKSKEIRNTCKNNTWEIIGAKLEKYLLSI